LGTGAGVMSWAATFDSQARLDTDQKHGVP